MTKRFAMVAVMALLCGCKDVLSGHQDVVATAAGQELTVERVAGMIAPAKSVPLRREVVDRVADMWVDYQLLAQAVARGDTLTDSATVLAASWPSVVQAQIAIYHDSVVNKAHPTQAQIDSAYNGNDYRYVSHILVRVVDTSAANKAAKRRVAQAYLDQVRHGADFAALASRVSEDPGSKQQGGSLGLVRRGVMVKQFEDAAFALKPGEISSSPVETAFGYHILWRPTLEQIRDAFTGEINNIWAGRADSLFLDSLTNKSGIAVRTRAAQYAKAAAGDLRAAKERSRVLATWRGGELTEKRFAVWLQAFPPQTPGMVAQAPDSQVNDFIKSIARNEMLINTVRQIHINVPRAAMDSIFTRYRAELTATLAGIGVTAESLTADTASHRIGKPAVAARRIDSYFSDLTNHPGSRQYFAVSPFLADVLRDHGGWKVNEQGVDRALERAKELRGPETPPAMSPAPIQPAPGGPPVGGMPVGPPSGARPAPRPSGRPH
ncbi:MAG TPA: peptidylprolyl isomerase [Gemmatimonadales bacterium]|jgi:hypothetical protein